MLERNAIPEDVWESALTVDGESQHYKMDVIWAYLQGGTCADGVLRFRRLAKIALLVLVLPHSNAAEERVSVW